MSKDGLGRGEDGRAIRRDGVEGARGGKAFDLAAVEQARIDAFGEIVQRLERPLRLALRDQRFHRLLADALERAQGVANLAVLDREGRLARVDAGRQALDLAPAHVLDEQGELVGQRDVEAHRRRVEFGPVMRLQPGRVIGDERVSGGVRLVEAVAGELVDQVEQLGRLGRA